MLKNNYIAALTSGLLLALSWPTYGFSLLIFIAFVPLLLLEKRIRTSDTKRKGLKMLVSTYIAFVLWNGITTWWIWYSTAFGMVFAVLMNALFMAILFWLYHITARKLPQKIHLVFLVALWLSFEKLHLTWPFSWPWLTIGNVFSEDTAWVQWYEYTGVFGGSLWVWIVNIGLFKTIDAWQSAKDKRALSRGIAKNVLTVAIPVIVSLIILKVKKAPQQSVNVVVLQPNVDPYSEKYYTPNTEVAEKLFALANEKVSENTDFIIAPETVFAKNMRIDDFEGSYLQASIKEYLSDKENINFLSGISMIKWIQDENEVTNTANFYREGLWYNDYNSAFLINRTDSIQLYHKSKLVVGVEHFPLKSLLEPLLGNIMIDLGGTVATKTTQEERSVFSSADNKFKAGPIICYESVYGEFVNGYVKNQANFLAIITNDGWWKNTQGHKQHLSYARLRAIETRRSIARSANTGISALINEKGEIMSSIPYDAGGVLAGSIGINDTMTFYVKYGDYIARLAYFTAGILFLFRLAKRKK